MSLSQCFVNLSTNLLKQLYGMIAPITGVPCKIKGWVESMIKGQLKCTIKRSRLAKTHSKFKESSAYYKFVVLYLAINAITGIKTVIVIHLFYAWFSISMFVHHLYHWLNSFHWNWSLLAKKWMVFLQWKFDQNIWTYSVDIANIPRIGKWISEFRLLM